MGITLDPKLTHIHNISVQAYKPLPIIKALTATGWGKQKETLMAIYKAVMRTAPEYASFVWSPIASSTSINKLKVMQNAALRTATGFTQDTNIQHLHDETLTLPIHEQTTAPRLTIQTENTTSITSPTQTPNKLQHSKALKNTIFNNGRYTTNIPTDPHTVTTTDIKQTCAIYVTVSLITNVCLSLVNILLNWFANKQHISYLVSVNVLFSGLSSGPTSCLQILNLLAYLKKCV